MPIADHLDDFETASSDGPQRAVMKAWEDKDPFRMLGRFGALQVRLACTPEEIISAQQLRYQTFHRERNISDCEGSEALDNDRFDACCQHLIVTDADRDNRVVGTCRLLDYCGAKQLGGFYTQSQFDISSLLANVQHGPNEDVACSNEAVMEIGRACIAADYRSRRTVELLWQGIWALTLQRRISLLFGCASFSGCNPHPHKTALGWLAENALLEPELAGAITPLEGMGSFPLSNFVEPNQTEFDDKSGSTKRQARAFASLPPLLKGYIRVGARIGAHAVIDRAFGTIDVFVALRTTRISRRYLNHYGPDASRFAA